MVTTHTFDVAKICRFYIPTPKETKKRRHSSLLTPETNQLWSIKTQITALTHQTLAIEEEKNQSRKKVQKPHTSRRRSPSPREFSDLTLSSSEKERPPKVKTPRPACDVTATHMTAVGSAGQRVESPKPKDRIGEQTSSKDSSAQPRQPESGGVELSLCLDTTDDFEGETEESMPVPTPSERSIEVANRPAPLPLPTPSEVAPDNNLPTTLRSKTALSLQQ